MYKKTRVTPVHYMTNDSSFLTLQHEMLLPEFNDTISVGDSDTLLKVLVIDTDVYVIRTLNEVLGSTSKAYFLNDMFKATVFIERYGINFIIIDPATLDIPYFKFFTFVKVLKEKYPDINVMILTSLRDKLLLQLLRSFRSYSIVSKYESMPYIEESIGKFFDGMMLTSDYVLDLLHDYEMPGVINQVEWDVLKLHTELSTPSQIALSLGRNTNVVYYYIKRLILKLRIGNRSRYLNLLAKLQITPVLR